MGDLQSKLPAKPRAGTARRLFLGSIVILVSILLNLPANAEDPFPLVPELVVTSPGSSVWLLEDRDGEASSEDIIAGGHDENFFLRPANQTSAGLTTSVWWLKFVAHNGTDQPVEWVFNVPFAITDLVDVYHMKEGRLVQHFELGDQRPRSQFPLSGEGFAVPLATGADQTSTVYVKFENVLGDGIDTYFEVSSPLNFAAKQSVISATLGAIFGGGILLFLYNAIVFSFVRTREYFWYLCYLGTALVTCGIASGAATRVLPLPPGLSEVLAPVLSSLTFTLIIQFSRSFLDTRNNSPVFDRALKAMMTVFLIPPLLISFGYGAAAATVVMIGGLSLSILPVFAAWMWLQGHKSARTFTLAWTVWFLAIGSLMARFLGLVPTNDFTLRILWIGILGEAVLFALALAERILLLRRQKEDAEQREREALEQSKSELEDLVDARTQELKTKNQQLVRLNQQKDTFFSIIAHDLINPLSVVVGISDYLRSKSNELSSEKIVEYNEAINDSAVNLHKLLENLLTWARLQKGEMRRTPTRSDLVTKLNETLALFQPLAQQKNIRIDVTVPPRLIAHADMEIVDTILRNLLSNAIKFSNEGGVIDLTLSADSVGFELTVRDDGVGMSSDTVRRLFELDRQESSQGTRGERGSGLGLQLCKELSSLHGGDLTVESTLGHGSLFKLTIPAETERPADWPKKAAAS